MLTHESHPELAMYILNSLPTSAISQIVENLHPRLYIDFVRYLPPEVCLKILEYLDPISLINVARCCRAWHNLALDRQLWEKLYYLEGWKALTNEIAQAEREKNGPSSTPVLRRTSSHDGGHAYKKRAISVSPPTDADPDTVMVDVSAVPVHHPAAEHVPEASIFGGPSSQRSGFGVWNGTVSRSNSSSARLDKGKGRARSPPESTDKSSGKSVFLQTVMEPRIPKSTLWVWDAPSSRYRINWKYLYTMRRRLEANWERGKYTNFQFPHPDYPEEGHGECVYSLQFNSQYLVSGSRDRTLKVWDMATRRCLRTLARHKGSVLCLQFDSDPEEDIIVSGSSDSDVIIWQFSTGKPLQILKHAHRESVLNVRFDKRILVTCSKDKTIKIFNRKPLRYGDLGYKEVDPVGTNVNYGYALPMTPDDYPVIPAWTMLGSLEGHSAAVNAVQIHDREVVSASGDRHIKVWDWPTQVCTRTIVGHNKGIACVQYDGRRIVSGSSDNEVKVFDRQTGLEVANLRSHSSLVRTIQAGFGDLPHSVEDDLAEAKKVDEAYFKAVEAGLLDERESRPRAGRRPGNAGSRRPEDICAYGAKLPPGGGGGKYGRIVSGSYDATIIIWRRDKEGIWKDQHHFKQEAAALAALQQHRSQQSSVPVHPAVHNLVSREALRAMRATGPGTSSTASVDPAGQQPTGNSSASSRSPANGASSGPVTLPPLRSMLTMELNQAETASSPQFQQIRQIIDTAVEGGQYALTQAIAAHPVILTHRSYVEAAIDRQQNPLTRSQLRQAYSSALIRAQFEQARQRREALRNQEAATTTTTTAGPSTSTAAGHAVADVRPPVPSLGPTFSAPSAHMLATAHQAHAHVPQAPNSHQVPPPAPIPAAAHPAATAGATPSIPSGSGGVGGGNGLGAAAGHGPAAAPTGGVTPGHPPMPPHPHIAQAPVPFDVPDSTNPPRVFKLQYDARRIICCSQRSVIVGWDFCNGDPELEEASRFFGHVD
jgi:F-box and WD-40 domain protein 1/11